VAQVITRGVLEQSATLRLFRHVQMSTAQQRIPVISALPVAYFVNGDTGLKQTTEMAWANKYLDAEEIAAIVPIPEKVLDDTSFDVWGTVRPLLEEAIGRALDAAVFFGTNKPASWPAAIVAAAVAAGNDVERGVTAAADGGLAEDFNLLFSEVEDDGYEVSGVLTMRRFRRHLRGYRDAEGRRADDVSPSAIWEITPTFAMTGMWPSGSGAAEAIAGDFTQGLVGVRQDITYKVLDQAVITDNTGAIVFNLPQQDMVALRVVARYAFQVPNPINLEDTDPGSTTRYPFAVMTAP
jgi:HK97 family phage major capsid protein